MININIIDIFQKNISMKKCLIFPSLAITPPDHDSTIPAINENRTVFLPPCDTFYESISYPKCYIHDSSHFLHSSTVVCFSQFHNLSYDLIPVFKSTIFVTSHHFYVLKLVQLTPEFYRINVTKSDYISFIRFIGEKRGLTHQRAIQDHHINFRAIKLVHCAANIAAVTVVTLYIFQTLIYFTLAHTRISDPIMLK